MAVARHNAKLGFIPIVEPDRSAATQTRRSNGTSYDPDRDSQVLDRVADSNCVDIGQADQQLAHSLSIALPLELLGVGQRETPPRFVKHLSEPAESPLPQPTCRFEVPDTEMTTLTELGSFQNRRSHSESESGSSFTKPAHHSGRRAPLSMKTPPPSPRSLSVVLFVVPWDVVDIR